MRVVTESYVYSLYITDDWTWVMHTWERFSDGSERWFNSHCDVSESNPFSSRVTYDAWR